MRPLLRLALLFVATLGFDAPRRALLSSSLVALRPPDFVNDQPGFTKTPTGLQIKDSKVGDGRVVEVGDRVVYQWEGYTIGYFGRPFQASKGVKGGDFEDAPDNQRFVVGRGEAIPALEEGVLGMREGGIRQLVFGPEIGYPMVGDEQRGIMADPEHDKVGPKPTTFSGMRALNFVLSSKGDQLDKTLLINVKLLRVDKPNGPRKF